MCKEGRERSCEGVKKKVIECESGSGRVIVSA